MGKRDNRVVSNAGGEAAAGGRAGAAAAAAAGGVRRSRDGTFGRAPAAELRGGGRCLSPGSRSAAAA